MSDTPLVIARRKIDSLSHDPANVRIHSRKNLDAIKASLLRFGQQKPVVIDRNGVVRAGNGTLAAAKALGWTEIDCIETSLEGSEATAYAIADNRASELAEWDEASLAAVLQSLEAQDKALLEATGFIEREMQRIVKHTLEGELDANDANGRDDGANDDGINDDSGRDEEASTSRLACPRCGERFRA